MSRLVAIVYFFLLSFFIHANLPGKLEKGEHEENENSSVHVINYNNKARKAQPRTATHSACAPSETLVA